MATTEARAFVAFVEHLLGGHDGSAAIDPGSTFAD
jgi:hypothetical protein